MENSLAEYELIREAGRGGMSTVYEARDRRSGRVVALKVLRSFAALPPAQQNLLVARLAREAQAITRLSHPNIVTIYETGEHEGRHFLAMEYLEGQTLRERLDQRPCAPLEAAEILSQIASAVDAVHAAGFVHRDLKPSNVMLLPDGRVKLMDFGIVRGPDETAITQAGSIVGSPAYMAPEQVRGEPGNASSDLWALGVLLHEMLSGRPPFGGQGIASVLYKVTHTPPPVLPGMPASVQSVLRRALDKNPSRRYASAGALANAFRTSLTGRPLKAYPQVLFWQGATLMALGLVAFAAALHWFLPDAASASIPRPVSAASLPQIAATADSFPPPLIDRIAPHLHKKLSMRRGHERFLHRAQRRLPHSESMAAVSQPRQVQRRRTISAALRKRKSTPWTNDSPSFEVALTDGPPFVRPFRRARLARPRVIAYRRAEPIRSVLPTPALTADAPPSTQRLRPTPSEKKSDDRQSLENLERFIYNN